MTADLQTITTRATTVGVLTIVVGVLVALWVVGSRALFGMTGPVAVIMACTLAPVGLVLQVLSGVWLRRALALGHRIVPVIVALSFSATAGILFGLTVPEITGTGPRSLFAPAGDGFALEMSTALCNPLAVVYLGTSIAAAIFARLALRTPRTEEAHDFAS
ncbi:hypothetical protein [Paramicrobacterium humi]|nr:hypothetical protein [Microbacterium humi]